MFYKMFLLTLVCLISVCDGEVDTLDFSNSDLESIILEALKNNETLSSDFSNATDEVCKPLESVKPDFGRPGQSISETKCLQYMWEVKNLKDQDKADEDCRVYLISQIKRGVIPEILIFVPPSVIFGGRDAKPAEFPHMGAIGWRAKDEPKWHFKCGGSLISEKFVVTAAHCTWLSLHNHHDVSANAPEVVRFGVENIQDDEFNLYGKPIDVIIKNIIRHPRYRPPRKYFDIALLELDSKVKFSLQVHPACLWTKPSTRELGTRSILTGWGLTEHGKPSTVLQVAAVDVLNTKKCNSLLHSSWNRNWHGFAKHQLCAGNLTGNVDTCQGDSGGPIQVKIESGSNSSINMVVGVTSFGINCGQKHRPGIYTKVSKFIKWIENNVWNNNVTESKETKVMPSLFKRKNVTLSGGRVTF
ncbi:unnamed protein product [Pieris macdunnoughi]|uniref:Peptidase S1 domain-containing protein n=1 Tax=Pieris macdunnoughi TaxID=345717 RepID=A0A821QLL5_9NEOP|nr:unnamed protein product [Pieris macdunnoughi]